MNEGTRVIKNGEWHRKFTGTAILVKKMVDIVADSGWPVVMLDGPSACGKTTILHRVRDVYPDKNVTIIPARDLADDLLRWIVDKKGDVQSFAERFEGTDVLCIEDADMWMRGKEATQFEMAQFVKSVTGYATVVFTGIELEKRLPVLCRELITLTDMYCFIEK